MPVLKGSLKTVELWTTHRESYAVSKTLLDFTQPGFQYQGTYVFNQESCHNDVFSDPDCFGRIDSAIDEKPNGLH